MWPAAVFAGLPCKIDSTGFAEGGTLDGAVRRSDGIVLSTNAIIDPSFESGIGNWSSGGGTWTWVSGVAHTGSHSLKFNAPASGDAFINYIPIYCSGGNVLYFSAWVKTQGASSNLNFRPVWWKGPTYPQDYLGEASIASPGVSGTSDWTKIEATVTAPATTIRVEFRLNGFSSGTAWWDDIYVENRNNLVYTGSGSYTSAEIDCDTKTTFGKITWKADLPSGCNITFKTMSSDDAINWNPGDWASAPSYTASDTDVLSPAARYLQFLADMTTSDSELTPLLREVAFTPAVRGFSPGGFKFKAKEEMTVDVGFNVLMTSNGCTVLLIDSKNASHKLNRAVDGSWTDSQHFRTKPWQIAGNVADGFAKLVVTGGKTALGADLFATSDFLFLIDNGPIAGDKVEFFPNPFSPNGDGKADQAQLMVSFTDQKTLTVRIYDMKGALVRTIADNLSVYGNPSVIWDGTDAAGKICPVGLYVYQAKTEDWVKTGTVVLAK